MKINKIGTITFHNSYNYGSALQAFALQTYLKKEGYQSKIIDYEYKSDFKQYKLFRTYSYLYYPKAFLEDLYRLRRNIKRKESFQEFREKYLTLTEHHYVDNDDMSELNKEFDAFICGSDQIWNLQCTRQVVPAYFLGFAADDKLKIAYAPSIASDSFDGDKEKLKELIGRLDYVSVREASTISGVSVYTDKAVRSVVDPTLLLEVSNYRKIEDMPENIPENYIFFYQLEDDDFKMAKWCKALAEEKGLPIVYIYEKKINIFKKEIYAYGVTPNQFLALIDHAAYIVTNSFHATVFSVTFEKKFCTFPTRNSSSRMRDLLENIGLSKRMWSESVEIDESIDYENVKIKLKDFSESSKRYLKEALLDK